MRFENIPGVAGGPESNRGNVKEGDQPVVAPLRPSSLRFTELRRGFALNMSAQHVLFKASGPSVGTL